MAAGKKRKVAGAARSVSPAPSTEWPSLLCLLAVLLLVVGFDIFRIGFFADDFHFLDVARRVPFRSLMSGQYGVWPWYRPLSRELFYTILVHAGRLSLPLAHSLSLICLIASAYLLWLIARRIIGCSAASAGVLLFLTYASTKFVTVWASGFQDLLSLALVLLSVWAALEKGYALAISAALLASFAKETGFLAFPLIGIVAMVFDRRLPGARVCVAALAAIALTIFIHIVARLAWHSAGTTRIGAQQPGRLLWVASQVLTGFVSMRPRATHTTWIFAGLAAVGAFGALALAMRPSNARGLALSVGNNDRVTAFLGAAALMGMAPALVGHATKLTIAHAYHFFPAIPWLALLLASQIERLGGGARRFAVPALVGWNVLGLGFTSPDLDRPTAWSFHSWDWQEAVRLTAVSQRLTEDVARELEVRPDSAVVLYDGLPRGCFFQTEDGPATREALGDPTARGYWVNEPGDALVGSKISILTFDTSAFHLTREHWSTAIAVRRAMDAVMATRGQAAIVFASYEDSAKSGVFDRAYLRAAGELLASGPTAYLTGLRSAGVADTTGDAPDSLASPLSAMAPGIGAAFASVLHHPCTAREHVLLSNALLGRDVPRRAGVELRIATTLDPALWRDRYRLARLLLELGGRSEAIDEFNRIASHPESGIFSMEATDALKELARADAASASRASQGR